MLSIDATSGVSKQNEAERALSIDRLHIDHLSGKTNNNDDNNSHLFSSLPTVYFCTEYSTTIVPVCLIPAIADRCLLASLSPSSFPNANRFYAKLNTNLTQTTKM